VGTGISRILLGSHPLIRFSRVPWHFPFRSCSTALSVFTCPHPMSFLTKKSRLLFFFFFVLLVCALWSVDRSLSWNPAPPFPPPRLLFWRSLSPPPSQAQPPPNPCGRSSTLAGLFRVMVNVLFNVPSTGAARRAPHHSSGVVRRGFSFCLPTFYLTFPFNDRYWCAQPLGLFLGPGPAAGTPSIEPPRSRVIFPIYWALKPFPVFWFAIVCPPSDTHEKGTPLRGTLGCICFRPGKSSPKLVKGPGFYGSLPSSLSDKPSFNRWILAAPQHIFRLPVADVFRAPMWTFPRRALYLLHSVSWLIQFRTTWFGPTSGNLLYPTTTTSDFA